MPTGGKRHIQQRLALKQRDDFHGAEQALNRATELDVTLPDAKFTLGVVLWQTGRAAEALASFRSAIEAKPDYAEAHYMVGTILRQQGHTQEALAEFRQAIQLQPGSADAYLSLGQLLHRTGDEVGSAAALKEAERLNKLKADEQAAAFALNRGVEKLKAGDVDGAVPDLSEAVRLAPDVARAHYQLALAFSRQGARVKARPEFAEAKRLAPYLDVPSN